VSKWRQTTNNVVGMVDMDGVLADFYYAFTLLLTQMYPKLQSKPIDLNAQQEYQLIKTWPKEAVEDVWREIKATPWWWNQLPPVIDRNTFIRLDELSHKYRIYFVTDRVSNYPTAEVQTTRWLNYYGIQAPSVICVPWSKKGELASMLNVTHAIEDSPKNAVEIYQHTEGRVFLINRGYNQAAKLVRVERVATVDEFLNAMEKDSTK